VPAALVLGAAVTPADASWCARYDSGSTNCGFQNHQQCLDTVRGVGGDCIQQGGGQDRPAQRSERRKAEPKPKAEPKKKAQPPPATAVRAPAPASPAAPAVRAAPPQQGAATFQSAQALILSGQYEAGIAAMKALGQDDHPDIAGMIGLANARLGRLDEARRWFQRALAADPAHLSTLFSSGALYMMRGDAEKARAELARIRSVCGNATCPQYRQLETLIAAKAR
jgi:hypothetical protein